MVTMREVESREEGGEGSAWLARLSAPRAALLPRVVEVRREKRGGRGWRAWARLVRHFCRASLR